MLIYDPATNTMIIGAKGDKLSVNHTYLLATGTNIQRLETKGKETIDQFLAPYGRQVYLHFFAMPTDANLNCAFRTQGLDMPYEENWWVPGEGT